jgi:hypothetical protein
MATLVNSAARQVIEFMAPDRDTVIRPYVSSTEQIVASKHQVIESGGLPRDPPPIIAQATK